VIQHHDDDAMNTVIQQLDSALHPEKSQPPFMLTEEMMVAPQPLSDEEQQRVITEVNDAIQAQLPEMIRNAVARIMAERSSNNQ